MARKFGVISAPGQDKTGIVFSNWSETEAVEVAEARDSDGNKVEMKAFNRTQSASGSGVLDETTGKTLVRAGVKITVGTKDYLATQVGKNETNTGFAEANISLEAAEAATITEYVAPTPAT